MPITIVSPGVEVIENDMSLRAVIPTGTNVTVPVFANQGPTGEVISISTVSEYEDIFGLPTNSAELYGYATVTQVVNSAAKVSVIRVPYGEGSGDTKSPSFTILGYPARGYKLTATGDKPSYVAMSTFSDGSTAPDYEGTATFLIGEPVQFTISMEEYYNFISGKKVDGTDEFVWSENIADGSPVDTGDLGSFAFLVLNIDKTVTNEGYEGFYLGLSDNAFSDPSKKYESITDIKTATKLMPKGHGLTDYLTIPEERLDFKLADEQKGCISQLMQESINSFDISDNKWNDTLNVGIFKIRQSTSSGDALKLSALMTKGYNAAVQPGRKTTTASSVATVDSFIENVSREKGGINIFVNPYLAMYRSTQNGPIAPRGLFPNGDPKIKVRMFTEQLVESAIVVNDAVIEEGEVITPGTEIEEVYAAPAGIDSVAANKLKTDVSFNYSSALYPLGLYSTADNSSKLIGNVPAKIEDALSIVANDELFDVDLVLEGGMGTIYVGAMDVARAAYKVAEENNTLPVNISVAETNGKYLESAMIFDDSKIIAGINEMRTSRTSLDKTATDIINDFKAVGVAFRKLATSQADGGRGDTFFIGDGLRHISIEGRDTKIEKKYKMKYSVGDETGTHSFSSSIYWPLRQLFSGVTSSYMAVYPHFIKMQHPTANIQYWAPASGAVAAKLAATDNKVGPWQAAAGITNGILSNALDISFSTTQRQRDDLYKISLNPIISTPESTQIHGIRTMIRTASSFDQITVRRLFLYINKLLRTTAKQFLFEGNTDFTRLRVIQTLKPVFDDLLTKRALYDYLLVCDTRNNTAQIIDDGILQIDFYGSGTRTAERISVGVTATRYGADLTELVGG